MAVEILACTSIDAVWTNVGGANRTISVAKPDDADTTYIKAVAFTGDEANFDVANTAISGSSTINSVTVRSRMRVETTADTSLIRMSDNAFANSTPSNPSLTTSYVDYVGCTSVTAPSGGAWTVAKLNALQVMLQGATLSDVRCTTLTVEVDYTPNSVKLLALSGVG